MDPAKMTDSDARSLGQIIIHDSPSIGSSIARRALAQVVKQKGHERCNCGSGKLVKNCCHNTSYKLAQIYLDYDVAPQCRMRDNNYIAEEPPHI